MISIQTWLALIIIGFLISPAVGSFMIALYLFNYSTAVIFGLWSKHRGYK